MKANKEITKKELDRIRTKKRFGTIFLPNEVSFDKKQRLAIAIKDSIRLVLGRREGGQGDPFLDDEVQLMAEEDGFKENGAYYEVNFFGRKMPRRIGLERYSSVSGYLEGIEIAIMILTTGR